MVEERFFIDHGMWHDRVSGQHLYTEDQLRAARKEAVEEYVERERERAALGARVPFERGSWQHAVDDELVNYGCTSQSFATPHEAVKWLLSIERDVPLACLSVTPECRESGCAAARNAGTQEDAHPSTGGMPREQVR